MDVSTLSMHRQRPDAAKAAHVPVSPPQTRSEGRVRANATHGCGCRYPRRLPASPWVLAPLPETPATAASAHIMHRPRHSPVCIAAIAILPSLQAPFGAALPPLTQRRHHGTRERTLTETTNDKKNAQSLTRCGKRQNAA